MFPLLSYLLNKIICHVTMRTCFKHISQSKHQISNVFDDMLSQSSLCLMTCWVSQVCAWWHVESVKFVFDDMMCHQTQTWLTQHVIKHKLDWLNMSSNTNLSFPHLVCNGTNDIWYICVLYHSALYIYVTLILWQFSWSTEFLILEC
jgi:hypothetical protein